MADTNVDLDSLQKAVKALDEFIGNIKNCTTKMKNAATDCHDNMGKDKYSQNAVARLGETVTKIEKSCADAEAIKGRIQRTIQDILTADD